MNHDNYKYLYATPDFFSVWALTHLKISQLFHSCNIKKLIVKIDSFFDLGEKLSNIALRYV